MNKGAAEENNFGLKKEVAQLGIISLEGATELSSKINNHLVHWMKKSDDETDN